jgi:hypothetical protein
VRHPPKLRLCPDDKHPQMVQRGGFLAVLVSLVSSTSKVRDHPER